MIKTKRRIAILVLTLVAAAAVIAGVVIFQKKNKVPESSTAISGSVKRDIKVPDINGDSDTDSSDDSDAEPALVLNIQTDSIDTGYTLPNQSAPQDIPPN